VNSIIGSSNKMLEINLSTKEVTEFKVTSEERKLYMGGKGLGLKYLSERMKPGIEPLAAENILAFMMGVYIGTGAPCSGRFAAVTKSPLTGIFVTSSCGGAFGIAFKTAGYDGLLIRGKLEKPGYLMINANHVKFKDASTLWGKDTQETQAALNLTKKDGALVIGPAGENRVLFANIASGHRFLGRGGFGAVMGAKNLKAIIAQGKKYKIVPQNPALFNKLKKIAIKQINQNQFTAIQYRNYGTAANFKFCAQGKILPVRNFTDGDHEQIAKVSGEAMQTKYNSRPDSCKPCSILCGHKGTLKDGRIHQIPEYETAALFGPNLGIFDPDQITEWNDLCGKLGVDTISTGSTLAFIMEAGEKGLIKTNLKFGASDGISKTIEDIAYRRNFGADLANGTRWLAKKYGGSDFAIQIKGLEMAGYDPRGSWGQGLSYAVANRGACHLSACLFPVEVFNGLLNPYTTRAKAKFVIFFEALNAAINSLQTCLFTSYAYILEAVIAKYTPDLLLGFTMQNLPDLALKLMDASIYSKFFEAITGLKLSQKDMLQAGHRIHTLERYMNTLEGISRKDDTLPARFLQEGRKSDPKKRTVPLEKMLTDYSRIRGYDEAGIPTQNTLKKLGIELSNTEEADDSIR